MSTKTARAKELDKRFDAGEDVSEYLDHSTARRANKERRLIVRVSGQVAEELEQEAVRQGVTKQRLLEGWITDRARSVARQGYAKGTDPSPVKGGHAKGPQSPAGRGRDPKKKGPRKTRATVRS